MSNNFIPKGLIPLEKLFDQNDVFQNPQSISLKDDVEDINIGTDEDIKNNKICASLDPEIKAQFLSYCKIIKMFFTGLTLI